MFDIDQGKSSKSEEKEVRAKLMAELGYLAYVVNAETKYCVFFEYSGHVDCMSLRICESKDRYNTELASTQYWRADGGVNAWLQSKIDHLKHILDTGEIDYGRMQKIIVEVAEYVF